METDSGEARDVLAEVERVRDVNEERLRRPGRYWMMLGTFFAVYNLAPLGPEVLPAPYGYLLPVAVIPVIAALFMWRRPRIDTRRQYTLDARMVRRLAWFVVPLVLIAMVNAGLYGAFGWWWLPPTMAVLSFVAGFFGGRALDRDWARTVSRRD